MHLALPRRLPPETRLSVRQPDLHAEPHRMAWDGARRRLGALLMACSAMLSGGLMVVAAVWFAG